jgi:glycosyltransferase involved in cell wall biosynthesis
LRILWYSNSPLASTGYGVQTAEVVPRLNAAGHPTAVGSNWGQYGATIEWNGIPIFPGGKDKYSNDIVAAHAGAWQADWTITLYDTWPLNRGMFPERVASWVPIDHSPVPPEVARWCKTVTPIAMSRFGQRMLTEQGIDSTYIPHSVNTKIFRPTPQTRGGQEPRKALGIPDDAFLVIIAAANQGVHPPRKAWAQMYLALSHFMRQHPDAWLYVHTDKIGVGGLDLSTLEQATSLPLERVRYTDAYSYASGRIPQEDLAALYSMADVMLASSMGEGFGIPVIEAQACGVPVIVSDFSAQPELCESRWLVQGQPYWDEAQAAWFHDPFVHSIVARLTDAYAARGDNGLRERAVAFAAAYDSDLVFERYWLPFLAELQAGLEPVPMNRAERRRRKKAAA